MTVRHPNCVICSAALLPHEGRAGPHCSRPACAGQYARVPARLKCVACGKPLPMAESAAGHCPAAACRQAVVRDRSHAAERVRREDDDRRAALAEKTRPAAAAALGLADQGRYPLAVIPRSDARLVPLRDGRRTALANHLARVVAETEDPTQEPVTDQLPDELSGELAAVLGQVCGLCEGYCCGHGGDAAYLRAPTIRRYRAAHPEKSAADVVADYLARVADASVEGSCIYHQATGCGLSREMRSETCNRHFCQGLKEFRRNVGDESPVRGFFVTVVGGVIGRAAFIDEAGTRRVPEPVGITTS